MPRGQGQSTVNLSPSTRSRSWVEVKIETSHYAGNFPRQLSAFLFGVIDEHYGAADYKDYVEWDKQGLDSMKWAWDDQTGQGILDMVMDEDHGVMTFVRLDLQNSNRLVFHFHQPPSVEQYKMIKERIQKFPEAYKEIEGRRYGGVSPIDGVNNLEIKGVSAEQIEETTSRSLIEI